MIKDLTVGTPSKVLRRFCLPLFFSVIFQQLYNIADSLIAGKFGGESALAAVGNGYEITLVLLAFAFGVNIGGSVISARLFGAKRYGETKTAVFTTLFASLFLCLVLMFFGFVFCDGLLSVINTPEEILGDSRLYLDIYLGGLPFVFVYNVSEGIFSALGDSKTPFIFLASSSTANILLDAVFASVFDNVVAGVAWATFICQGVSSVLSVLFLVFKLKGVKTDGKIKIFSFQILKDIACVAVPSIFQQLSISVGNIIIQAVINGFGGSVIAGYSAAVKLNNLVITSVATMGNGVSAFTSQNLGADKPERVRAGHKSGLLFTFLLCVPFVILYSFGGGLCVKFFIKEPTALAVSTGKTFLIIVAPFYFLAAVKLLTDGVLRGAGMMKEFLIGTFTDLFVRVVLAIVFAKTFGTTGIWIAWPLGWIVGAAISFAFYRTERWAKRSVLTD